MKIVILANEGRKAKDKPIIDETEQAFDTVIYAPIRKVRFDLILKKFSILSSISSKRFTNGISVKFEGGDISDVDCILPIPTTINSELFYAALRMLDGCLMPFDAKSYMLIKNEEMLFDFLSSNDVPVRKLLVVTSNVSLDKIDERVKYPVIVRPPRKRVMVTNKETLKDVLSLYKFGTPIRIETPIKSKKNVWVFVLEDEVIAAYERTKDISKVTAVDDKLKKLAIKVRKLTGCDYCAMRFLLKKNKWIFDRLTVSPNFSNFQKITGINISRYIVSNLRSKTRESKEPSWYRKIEDVFRFRR